MANANGSKRSAKSGIKKNSASTSFRRQEVKIAVEIFNLILRRGDPSVLLVSEEGRKLHQKFQRMKNDFESKG